MWSHESEKKRTLLFKFYHKQLLRNPNPEGDEGIQNDERTY